MLVNWWLRNNTPVNVKQVRLLLMPARKFGAQIANLVGLGQGLDNRANRRSNPHKGKYFYILWNVHTGLGPIRTYIQRESVPISSRVEWPEREADHSPPSTVKDMNKWIYACHPPIRLNGVDMDKIRHLFVLLQLVIPQNGAHIFKKTGLIHI